MDLTRCEPSLLVQKVSLTRAGTSFNLNAEEPAEAAVLRIAAQMIRSARQHEAGIIEDIDTEFVHQYRVQIRKTRSLLGLFKKTLSLQRARLLKSELKVIGSRTNRLRDLDVFLLDQDDYRSNLPEDLHPGIKPLLNRIKRRRTAAHKQVSEALRSPGYKDQAGELLVTLQADPEFVTKQSRMAIKTLVCKKVLAQYQAICHAAAAIDADTPDEAVHPLRIECKKLRYLLELFSELFPRKQLKQPIRLLKKLQDNLGRLNGYSVQLELLLNFSRGKTISAAQLASIDGLTAVLFNKQCQKRSLVVEDIAGFTDASVKEQIQLLVRAAPKEETG